MTHISITDSARGQQCTIRLPDICSFNVETTVFAHYNSIRLGSGRGIKSLFGAFCCDSCHSAIDGRTKTALSREYLRLAHADGVFETMGYILRNEPKLWEKFLNE